jgi:iron complex outermembrane receptor protein
MSRFCTVPSRAFLPQRLALAVALALPLGSAFAQAAPATNEASEDTTTTTLDTIQVTAQRRVENIQDVPMAITVLSGEKLDVLTSGGDDIRLLSGRLPSLNIESSFGRAFPRFYIRGLGNTDFDLNASQPVSLVYDDVVQENPILKGFPMFDMAQVEMDRGPQGTLFGRNSPAGVIKFSSARPEDTFGGYGKVSLGTFDTFNLEGAVTGPIGPGVSGRLSVLHQRRDDWVDNATNGPGDDLEGYRDTAARAQLLIAPGDDFEALLNVHGRKLAGTARLFRANIIKPGSNDFVDGFERDKIYIDGRNEQDLSEIGGNVRLRWDLGSTTLYSITGYESVDAFSRGDIDGGSVYTFDFNPSDGYDIGPPLTGARFNAQSADGLPDHEQLSQEFRLESNEWGRFDWQAGLFWFNEQIDVDSFNYDDFAPGQPQNGHASQHQDNTAWAVFASGDFDATDRLKLRAGVRYTRDEKDFTAQRDQPTPFNPPVIDPISVHPSASNVSWDLSATYALSDATNLYARVATGFRAPSVQGRLLFADLNIAPAEDYVTVADTETVLSWEAGAKTQLWDNRLRLGFALYRYTVSDQQLTAVGGDQNVARLVNADRTIGQGVELDLAAYLTDNLLVTLGASYNDTEIQDDDLSVFPCAACTVLDPADPNRPGAVLIDGNSLPQAPKNVINLTARYGVPVASGEFFVYTDWAYRSEINFFLYDSVEFTGKPMVEGGLRVGYNWHGGDREIAVFGRNILDEERIVGGIDFNNLTGFVNEPRTWGVQFSTRF